MTTRLLPWLIAAAAICSSGIIGCRDRGDQRGPQRRSPLAGIAPPVRLTPTLNRVPDLGEPAPFVPTDRIVTVEISEYVGYAGLIVANGGLEPSQDSVFFRDHNFRVRLTLREKENFADLNTGKLGASATTADVVAVYGKHLNAFVPVLIGFSRGADGVVTRRSITTIQGLKGSVVATAQFSEAEFLIRYLAHRTDLKVATLPRIDTPPDPTKVNLIFTEDAFAACDLLLNELIMNRPRVSACAGWEPKTSEVVRNSGGAAHFLTTNRNMLIIADVLMVNRQLAEQQPEMMQGLVKGVLAGNESVLDNPEQTLSLIAKAFNWSRDKARDELAKVQLARMSDNVEFFAGGPNEIGSFAQIYQTALDAYENLIDNPPPYQSFLHMRELEGLRNAGTFEERPAEVERLRPLVTEQDPLESLPAPQVVPQARSLPTTQ